MGVLEEIVINCFPLWQTALRPHAKHVVPFSRVCAIHSLGVPFVRSTGTLTYTRSWHPQGERWNACSTRSAGKCKSPSSPKLAVCNSQTSLVPSNQICNYVLTRTVCFLLPYVVLWACHLCVSTGTHTYTPPQPQPPWSWQTQICC